MTELREQVHVDRRCSDLISRRWTCRYRIQNTRDLDGQPDELSWCDVSMMSNADIEPKDAVAKDGSVVELVDYVDRDRRARS